MEIPVFANFQNVDVAILGDPEIRIDVVAVAVGDLGQLHLRQVECPKERALITVVAVYAIAGEVDAVAGCIEFGGSYFMAPGQDDAFETAGFEVADCQRGALPETSVPVNKGQLGAIRAE